MALGSLAPRSHIALIRFAYMTQDWTTLFECYRGKWIALADDEETVLAAADTAKEAFQKSQAHTSAPLLYRVPDTLDAFVGYEIQL